MTLEFLNEIFNTCIIPLISIVSIYLIKFVKAKLGEIALNKQNTLEIKYLEMLDTTISSCVLATSQTYVDSLKKANSFDANAQKIAFQMTMDAVLKVLNEESKKYLNEMVGDLNLYITQKIEAEVNYNKTIIK